MERRVIVEMNNQPLVSVPVITYNSSKFVLETLESIKAQTYQNIELIISDDCSTDNTVDLCRKWVEENKKRFNRTQIITSEINMGVSANLNRAEVACQGNWVKFLDGDDLLLPTCVQDYMDFVLEYPETIYMFSRIEAFGASEERNKYYTEKVFDYTIFDLDAKQQYEKLIWQNCIMSSTCMYNRKKNAELGLKNDERISLLEDWPRWINVTKKGIRLSFLDKVEVRYRLHEKSLSTSGTISPSYMLSNLLLSKYYQVPYVWSKGQHRRAVMYYLKLQTMLKPESRFWKILFKIFSSTIGKGIDYSMIEI